MKKLHQRLFFFLTAFLIITQSISYGQEISQGELKAAEDITPAINATSTNEFYDSRTDYTPVIPKIEIDEAIDTLYPDPLSKVFRDKNKLDDKEKTKSVAELLAEFESKAATIASNTVIPIYIEEKPKLLPDEEPSPAYSPKKEEEEEKETQDADNGVTTDEDGIDDSDDYTTVGIEGDEIDVDDGSEPLPDMLTIETDTDDETAVVEATEETTEEATDEKDKTKDLHQPLEPSLLVDGNPALDQSEITRMVQLSGVLIPEIHPVARKSSLFRWALKLDNGDLVPVRSTLKILQTVTEEELLDSEVELTGHYQTSALNKGIRYFIAKEIGRRQAGDSDAKASAATVSSDKLLNKGD